MSNLLRALLLSVALLAPGVSFSANPPSILLANVYRNQADVAQYLVSEKLDGVRAIWDGQTLRFRSGKEIHAPRWFVDGLPKQSLDGELWLGRGSFERLSGIVRRELSDDAEWRQVRYMVFELPGAAGTFRERAGQIKQVVRQANVPWLQEIQQFPAVDRNRSNSSSSSLTLSLSAPSSPLIEPTSLRCKTNQTAVVITMAINDAAKKYQCQET